MESKTFQVPNIGCDGCVRTIKNEVSLISGVKLVNAEVSTKTKCKHNDLKVVNC